MQTDKKPNSILWFFALIFLLTWALWAPAIWLSRSGAGQLAAVFHYLGGAVPMLVAVAFVYLVPSAEKPRAYWGRLIDFRRITAGWYLMIFLIVPLLTGLAILLAGSAFELEESATRFLQQPLAFIPFAAFMLVFGPLPEELAWRGYGQDRLQSRISPLAASFVIGICWTVWHLPLFFIEGSYQHGLGVGTLSFWLYMADKIPQSIIMAWVFNHTRRSTLSAVLFHFMVNLTGEIVRLSPRAEVIYIGLWWAAALGVIALWRGRKSTGDPVGDG